MDLLTEEMVDIMVGQMTRRTRPYPHSVRVNCKAVKRFPLPTQMCFAEGA